MSQPVATSTPLHLKRGFSLLLTMTVGFVLFTVYFGHLYHTAAADSKTTLLESTTNLGPSQNAVNDVARNTRSIAWGDVDGDGDLDLAVGNGQDFTRGQGQNRANYILRYENGRLIERVDIPLDNRRDTRSVAWGDWDGDGDLDLAVGNYNESNQIYENKNGDLTPAWESVEPLNTTSIAWGDVDGDGDLDLAIGNEGQANQVYENENGTLTLGWESPDQLKTTSIAWGDWDNDGDLDLAVGNDADQNQVFENVSGVLRRDNGWGWQSPNKRATYAIAWGDWNNDGYLDLAVGNNGQPNQIFENQQHNPNHSIPLSEVIEFDDPLPVMSQRFSHRTTALAWGDWDNDGDLDLAIGGRGFKQTIIYENRLDTNNNRTLTNVEIFNGTSASSVAWGDVNDDGLLDLAIGRVNSQNDVEIDPAIADNQLEISAQQQIPVTKVNTAAWGDWDNDGDLDLAVGRDGVNQVYENIAGTLIITPVWQATAAYSTTALAWADWDNDGDLDLAIGNNGQQNQLYENISGTLQFDPARQIGWQATAAYSTTTLAWADWENDGDLDLAIGNNGQHNQIYENISGTLQFDPAKPIGWQAAEPFSTTTVAWGDWNNDGNIDLAVANDGQPDLIYTNRQGELSRDQEFTTSSNEENHTQTLTWGDWDMDGNLDLIFGYSGGISWAIYKNNQGQSFTLEENARVSKPVSSLSLGDVDHDGDLDLAITYADESSIYLNSRLENAPKILLGDSQNSASALIWGDIDNDGDLDLVVEQNSESLQVYQNPLQGASYSPNNQPVLTVQRPVASPATNSSIPTQLIEETIIPIPYSYFDSEGDPIGRVEAFYSVNGGGSWLPANATTNTITTAVPSNFALHLDGRDDRITFSPANSQTVTQTATTLMTRVRFDTITGTQMIYAQGSGKSSGFNLYLHNGRLYAGAWSKSNNWNGSYLESAAINPNQWYDIAMVHQAISQTMILYMDGRAVANVQAGVSTLVSLTQEISLGSTTTNTQFHNASITTTAAYLGGYLDQLTVWDKVLSAAEVRRLPQIVLSGQEDGLRHLWTFDEGLGEQIKDTAAERHGTLQDNDNNSGALWVPQPTKRIFYWDTAASGLFGRVDNATFRLVVYPQVRAANVQPTNTFQYPNSTPNNFQRAAVSARSYPFRVQGTQLRVINESATPVENALIYRLPAGQTRGAQPLLNNQNGTVLTTDKNGALRGRGTINAGDQLIALHPMTTSYRVPPQLFLDGRDSYVQINNTPINDSLTLEYWLLSGDQSGTLLSHPALTLTYQSQPVAEGQLSSPTTFALTAAHQAESIAFTDQPPLNDGFPHHLAFSWQASSGDFMLVLDGQTIATDTLAIFTGTIPIAPIQIGRGINGSLDEMRLWQTTRSAAEISATMFITISPQTADLAGYWPVQATESRELQDLTPNNHDGRLVGGAAVRTQPLYRVYQTSASPTPTGLDFQTVNIASQQILTTSAANVLMLFDLTVSLEWDASMDPEYQAQLKRDIERASEILFDLTNGQIAFGRVTVYQSKQQWDTADIQIYASNNQRPNANLGGIVTDYMTDTLASGEVIANAYLPGKIRMGATWNRYGNPGGTIGEDWPRALAHEFGHYALFLFDNYLGIDASKIIIETNCQGSAMTDAYRLDYSEFLNDPTGSLTVWDTTCNLTLAEQTTGRSDWETLQYFYPFLNLNQAMSNNGPNNLPLAVTQVRMAPNTVNSNLLPIPIYYTADAQGNTRSFNRGEAQAYLIQQKGTDRLTDDDILYLGTVNGPLILARGAAVGDRLCIFDNSQQPAPHRCETLTADTSTISLTTINDWQPEIIVRPVNSQTLAVTVTLNTDTDRELNAQIFPGFRPTVTIQALTATLQQVGTTNQYTAVFEYPLTVFDGYVRVWSNDGAEFISRFMNAPGWDGNTFTGFGGNRFVGFGGNRFVGFGGNRFVGFGGNRFVGFGGNRFVGFGGNRFVGFGGNRFVGFGGNTFVGLNAPVSSPDGQVILYNTENILAPNPAATLQRLDNIPHMSSWLTPVGQIYRYNTAEPAVNALVIQFQYLARELPNIAENQLKIYYLNESEENPTWVRLENTQIDSERNLASAKMRGPGVYALMATVELPRFNPGWNLFGYPLYAQTLITDALASIDGSYTIVYALSSAQGWQSFASAAPDSVRAEINTLTTLQFGQGYWIYITETVTAYLPIPTPQTFTATIPSSSPAVFDTLNPPAIFYGVLTTTVTTPISLTAQVGERACGTTTVTADAGTGTAAYVLRLTCQVTDQPIAIYAYEQLLIETAVWNNTNINRLNLILAP